MSASSSPSDILRKAAKEAGVEIPDSVLAAVRSAPKASQLGRWVQNLNETTLGLPGSGALDASSSRMHGSDDAITDGLPMLVGNVDLQRAIDVLDASSQQFALRTRTLTTQKALLAPRSTTADRDKRDREAEKWTRTFSQSEKIRLLNEAKSDEVLSSINTKQELVCKDVKNLSAAIGERLKADDRLLEILEQGTRDPSMRTDLSELLTRTQQLSEILQTQRTRALMDRLDRIYLAAMAEAPSNSIGPAEAAEAIPELKRDIQSLYTEIHDVVAMSTGQTHVNKVQSVLAGAQYQQQQKTEQSLQDISSRVARMTTGLHRLSLQVDRLQGQQQAIHEMSLYAAPFTSATATGAGSTDLQNRKINAAPHGNVNEKTSQAERWRLAQYDNDSLSDAVSSATKTIEEARQLRCRALALLRNVDSPTDANSLDALDQRIAATNRTFDSIVKPPLAR